MKSKGTTDIGHVNRNRQRVIRKTDKRGTDHNQFVYILQCEFCRTQYGANGSDIWLRRCPSARTKCKAGGGRPGIT